jgi:hypothetical protein
MVISLINLNKKNALSLHTCHVSITLFDEILTAVRLLGAINSAKTRRI